MRCPNVLVRKQSRPEVRFVDFDWSGWHKASRYRYPPNPQITASLWRPKQVKAGAIMEQDHDVQTLAISFGISGHLAFLVKHFRF